MNFTGKVVIVTGSSSGIGASSAQLFAKYGARLTLIGRNEERLKNVRDKCIAINGMEPLCFILDLTEKGSCEQAVSKTVETFGRIDVLVNNAGKFMMGCLFDETIDSFDEMIDINLRVPYKMTHLCLPHLMKTKGNVVNLAATSYNRVRHGFMPHGIAKAGLEKFTKMAAVELACEGVRVNSVNPGMTRTNILSNLALTDKEVTETYEDFEKSLTVLEPEEVAKMVVFVASDVCPSINGAAMYIDGGTVML